MYQVKYPDQIKWASMEEVYQGYNNLEAFKKTEEYQNIWKGDRPISHFHNFFKNFKALMPNILVAQFPEADYNQASNHGS